MAVVLSSYSSYLAYPVDNHSLNPDRVSVEFFFQLKNGLSSLRRAAVFPSTMVWNSCGHGIVRILVKKDTLAICYFLGQQCIFLFLLFYYVVVYSFL